MITASATASRRNRSSSRWVSSTCSRNRAITSRCGATSAPEPGARTAGPGTARRAGRVGTGALTRARTWVSSSVIRSATARTPAWSVRPRAHSRRNASTRSGGNGCRIFISSDNRRGSISPDSRSTLCARACAGSRSAHHTAASLTVNPASSRSR